MKLPTLSTTASSCLSSRSLASVDVSSRTGSTPATQTPITDSSPITSPVPPTRETRSEEGNSVAHQTARSYRSQQRTQGVANTPGRCPHCQKVAPAPQLGTGMCRSCQQLLTKGQLCEVVAAVDTLVDQGLHVDQSVFYGLLKRCISEKDLVLGTRVHALAAKGGYESDAFLANHIICMYASHGRLEEARQVFSKVASPSRYMWASIIAANARHGMNTEAKKLYQQDMCTMD